MTTTQTVDTQTDDLKCMGTKEFQEYRTYNAATVRSIEAKAKTASVEQLKQLSDTTKTQMLTAKAAYEQAVAFRPSYAPAGRPTREEQTTLSAFWDARKLFRFCATLYVQAKKANK